MINLWILIQILIGFNLIFPLVLYMLHLLKSGGKKRPPFLGTEADYAIIVTAYGQTLNLETAVNSIIHVNYSNFLVYVVLDNCNDENFKFDHDKVILLKPDTILAGNVKSHFYAISHFKRQHERLTIIDSDNLVDREYLNQLNLSFDQGFKAVQGIREAKNLNTIYACLDAARDIYYHYYDGKLLFETGSSATLSGSGMAFSTELYRSCLESENITGAGFDKVLQYNIVKGGNRIAFAPNAIVKDEKTSGSDQLVNQRARWINTWFKYFFLGFNLIVSSIKNISWNQFLFGVVLLRPPLFIFLLLSFVCAVVNIWLMPFYVLLWGIAFACFIIGFGLSLAGSKADKRIYNSLSGIPGFMFYQLKALVYSANANKRSVATVHPGIGNSSEDEVETSSEISKGPHKNDNLT